MAFNQYRKNNDEIYQNQCKERLSNNIHTKIKTTMIAAIAAFEKNFGHIIGLDTDNPTEEQEQLLQLWEDCRKEILDKGNHNIRAASQEISQYTVTWNRYQTDFKFITSKEQDNE